MTLIGDDTVVAALCDRATEPALKALRELVLGREVRYFLEVPLPRGHIHIDGIFMVLDERLCLICEEPFQTLPCRLHEDGRVEPRHVLFTEFLDVRGFERIPLTCEERRGGHLNVVVTERSRRAIGFETAVRVAAEMARFGWVLDTFPAGELFAGNGGAHCMTCPLLVE